MTGRNGYRVQIDLQRAFDPGVGSGMAIAFDEQADPFVFFGDGIIPRRAQGDMATPTRRRIRATIMRCLAPGHFRKLQCLCGGSLALTPEAAHTSDGHTMMDQSDR